MAAKDKRISSLQVSFLSLCPFKKKGVEKRNKIYPIKYKSHFSQTNFALALRRILSMLCVFFENLCLCEFRLSKREGGGKEGGRQGERERETERQRKRNRESDRERERE
jgi:hypothetical protein